MDPVRKQKWEGWEGVGVGFVPAPRLGCDSEIYLASACSRTSHQSQIQPEPISLFLSAHDAQAGTSRRKGRHK